MDIKNRQYR